MGSYKQQARWYDALYRAAGKDYETEAAALLELVASRGIRPSSLLDVACGTGMHLLTFRDTVAEVVGVDLSPEMLEVARETLGDDVALRHGDMRLFDLGRTFDIVTCLFSAIGHVRDAGDLDAAIQRMAAHVEPGGLLLVEPWLTPDAVSGDGLTSLDTATTADGVVSRACRSVLRGDVLVVEFAWAVADREHVATETESFRMPLFTRDRYLEAFEKAGLTATWEDVDALRAKRGLVVGRRPGLAA